jgi:uncharacterized membrane protein
MIFAAPLPTLTLCGMEHTLHSLLTLVFVFYAGQVLSDINHDLQKNDIILFLLAPLITSTRFEGGFLIFVVGMFFLLKKKYSKFILVSALGSFPILFYGAISVYKGWHYLPNSVLLEGNKPVFSSFDKVLQSLGFLSLDRIENKVPILLLIVTGLIFLIYSFNKKNNFWNDLEIMIAVFLLTCNLQVGHGFIVTRRILLSLESWFWPSLFMKLFLKC